LIDKKKALELNFSCFRARETSDRPRVTALYKPNIYSGKFQSLFHLKLRIQSFTDRTRNSTIKKQKGKPEKS